MKKINEARKYDSSKLEELLDEITPIEMEQTKVKMQLAANIEDFMKEKGWNKSQFAEKVGKNPSEITKWFSGTQNFTTDVLVEIASALNIELTALFGKKQIQGIYSKKIVVKSIASQPAMDIKTPISQGRDGAYILSVFQVEAINHHSQSFYQVRA
jgi:transcriptional regulator with XRE-family HTH domain